jgi:hypothetical protein
LLQVLSGRRSQQRTSESNLAITLISIVFMHLLCNALRVYLGVMVVLLVGNSLFIYLLLKHNLKGQLSR